MGKLRLAWYRVFYFFARKIAAPFVKIGLNYRYDTVKPKHRPFLIFSNHTTLWDFMLFSAAVRPQIYYVAGEHLFRNKVLRFFVTHVAGMIIRKKGAPADEMIAEMKEAIKLGANVWMSPEGARSINGETVFISPATGKLVLECAELGAGLVTFRIHGGYLRRPRWGKYIRKGKMWGEFVAEYTPEELLAMSVDEVNELIRRDMYVNAFQDQKEKNYLYTGKDIAEDLETVLYVCPKCRQIGKLHSKGDILSCECGYSVKFNEKGFFEKNSEDELYYDNIRDWDHFQRDYIKSKMPEFLEYPPDKAIEFDEHQILKKVAEGKGQEIVGRGKFAVYKDRFEFETENEKLIFPISEIAGFAFSLQMSILFSLKNGDYYDVGSEVPRSAVKYMVFYRYLIGKEYY